MAKAVVTKSLNADFSKRAFMETGAMEWKASPSPTVWRKRLDLVGGEYSRVTSVVRYDRESSFPAHDHPQGIHGEGIQGHRPKPAIIPATLAEIRPVPEGSGEFGPGPRRSSSNMPGMSFLLAPNPSSAIRCDFEKN